MNIKGEKAGDLIGYKRDGSPIYLIGGGSEPLPENTIVTGTLPTGQPVAFPAPSAQYFTAEQLEEARRQERSKVHDRLSNAESKIKIFEAEIEGYKSDKKTAEDEASRKIAEAAKLAREEAETKMSAKELIESKQIEWDSQIQKQKDELARAKAEIDKEREFLSLTSYTQRRVAEEVAADHIIPELLDYINGGSIDEIESSITTAKEKSAKILAEMSGIQPPAVTPGVSPTGRAPNGPLDSLSATRDYTPADIQNMSMAEYAEYRRARGIDRAGNNKGLFS